MKTGSEFLRSRKRVLTCVMVLLAGTPLCGWAQGAAPKPTPTPAAPPQTITLPTPAAAKDSAAKAAAAMPGPATVPALSDSARAALKSEIERELKVMADSLKLTPDQRAQARPILLDHAYQVRNLRQKYATQARTPAVVEAMQKEMQVLRDSTDGRLGHVFSAHQMTQYKVRRDAWLGQTRTRLGISGAPHAASGAAPAAMHAPADTMHKAAPAGAQSPADSGHKTAPAGAAADTAKKK